MTRLEAVGTRVLRVGLGVASLGLSGVALTRALGIGEPLAPWASGFVAIPLHDPLGVGLALVLAAVSAGLVSGRAVHIAAGALALLLAGSLVLAPPTALGAILDLGLLGGALALIAIPPVWRGRLPPRLAAALTPGETTVWGGEYRPGGLQRLALRVGLALTFLLAGWGKFADTTWCVELLGASGGVAGWPLVGNLGPTGVLLWLGTAELFLSGLLVWGPPARLASAAAAALLALDLLALHTPSLLAAKLLGLLGAAVAGYCWASGATALENAQIGWLRAPAGPPTPPDGR